MFQDLREWLEEVKRIKELVVIKEVETDDFGPVSQITSRNEGPAVLFEDIKGFQPGFRMATNLMSNIRTFNLALGLPLDGGCYRLALLILPDGPAKRGHRKDHSRSVTESSARLGEVLRIRIRRDQV